MDPNPQGGTIDVRHLESLYASMREGVCLHELVCDDRGEPIDYRILGVNPAYERITGLAAADVVGKLASEAYAQSPPPYLKLYAEIATTGESRSFDTFYEPLKIHLRISVVCPAPGIFATVFLDVTELATTAEQLRRSRQRFRHLYEAVQAGVVVHRKGGEIIHVNEVASRILGFPAEEICRRGSNDPEWSMRDEHGHAVPGDQHPGIRTLRTGEPIRNVICQVFSDDPDRARWLLINTEPLPGPESEDVEEVIVTFQDITTLKQAQQHDQFQTMLLDQIQDLVTATDLEGRVTYVNDAVCRLIGRPREQLIGRNIRSFGEDPRAGATQEDILRCTLREGAWRGEVVNETAEGKRVLLDCRTQLVRGVDDTPIGMVGISTDITERKNAERALQEQTTRLQMALDAAKAGTWVWQPATNTVLWDERMYEIFGLGPKDYDGTVEQWLTLIHPDERQGAFSRAEAARDSGQRFEAQYRIKVGDDWRVVNSQGRLIADTGAMPYMVGMLTDVTDRVRADQDRRNLEAQVQHAQKLESLGILAGGIAHDFNNLLVAILGNADLALEDMSELAPERRFVQEIHRAAKRASELTNQMLAYSGKGRFVVRSLDLNELVEEMGHLLEVSISKRAVLRYDLAEGLPPTSADVNQMRQVIMNLITNASDAVGQRSGIITVRTGVVEADRQYLSETYLDDDLEPGYFVLLEVSDTGGGMAPETKTRLFDPFYTTKSTGRGLGLAAVLGIIRGHHGAIKVYSELGKGTTFRVLLPVNLAPADPLETPVGSEGDWQGQGTVMVADDEETVRNIAGMMLQRMGFEVISAANGQEAVDLYRDHDGPIRAVLLDMTMPKLSGDEAFRELRKIDPNATVVLTSGYNEQDATNRFAGKGLAGFIQKPFAYRQLMEAFRQALTE